MADILGDLSVSQAFTAVPHPYLLLDRSLRIRAANAAYLSVTGRRGAELLDVPLFEAFPDNPADPTADGVRNLNASLQRVLRAGRQDELLVQRYDVASSRRPDVFVYRLWSPVNIPVHDENGRVVGVLHQAEDVTALAPTVPGHTGPRGVESATGVLAGRALRSAAMALRRYRSAHAGLAEENRVLREALRISVSAGMPGDSAALRRAWWWHRIESDASTVGWATAACSVLASELPVDSAAIAVCSADGGPTSHELLDATDRWALMLEELAFTVGEGPASEAWQTRIPVMVGDLSADDNRWPVFANAACTTGLAAMFAFPLLVGAHVIGTLSLYSRQPGVLTGAQLLDAVLVADLTTSAILRDLGVESDEGLDGAVLGAGHFEQVHVAAGVLAVRHDITPDEALSRLRADAFARDQSILAVAKAVLAGE